MMRLLIVLLPLAVAFSTSQSPTQPIMNPEFLAPPEDSAATGVGNLSLYNTTQYEAQLLAIDRGTHPRANDTDVKADSVVQAADVCHTCKGMMVDANGRCNHWCSKLGWCGSDVDFKEPAGGTNCQTKEFICNTCKGMMVDANGRCNHFCSTQGWCGSAYDFRPGGTDCRPSSGPEQTADWSPVHGLTYKMVGSTAIAPLDYIGCFKDDAALDMNGAMVRHKTVQQCQSYCENYQYRYFAIQNTDTCLCDDDFNTPYTRYGVVADSECPRYVGGPYRNAVYHVKRPMPRYLGSFNDDQGRTDVDNWPFTGDFKVSMGVVTESSSQSILDICQDMCRGFIYFALQGNAGSKTCYCDDSYNTKTLGSTSSTYRNRCIQGLLGKGGYSQYRPNGSKRRRCKDGAYGESGNFHTGPARCGAKMYPTHACGGANVNSVYMVKRPDTEHGPLSKDTIKQMLEWIGEEYKMYNVPFCWRGGGATPLICPKNKPDQIGLNCYSNCPSSHPHGALHLCWNGCRGGYVDFGMTCSGCWGDFPFNFRCNTYSKSARDRQVGWIDSCPDDRQREGDYCYKKCSAGLTGCGEGCTKDTPACVKAIFDMVMSPVTLLANIVTFGTASLAAKAGSTAAKLTRSWKVAGSSMRSIQHTSKLTRAWKGALNFNDALGHAGTAWGAGDTYYSHITTSIQAAKESFADLTHPEIDRKVRARFGHGSQAMGQIAAAWGRKLIYSASTDTTKAELNMVLEMVDPTGLIYVYNAYNKPNCKSPQDIPGHIYTMASLKSLSHAEELENHDRLGHASVPYEVRAMAVANSTSGSDEADGDDIYNDEDFEDEELDAEYQSVAGQNLSALEIAEAKQKFMEKENMAFVRSHSSEMRALEGQIAGAKAYAARARAAAKAAIPDADTLSKETESKFCDKPLASMAGVNLGEVLSPEPSAAPIPQSP